MDKTASIVDLARGYSDLAMFAAGVLVLAIILLVKPADERVKKNWVLTFFLLSLAAGLGYIQHTYDWSETASKIIWVFLYFVMFDACRGYTATLVTLNMKDDPNVASVLQALLVMEIIFYFFTAAMQIISSIHMIGLFMVFAAICTIKCLVATAHLKRDKVAGSGLLITAMVFLACAVVLQAVRSVAAIAVLPVDFTTLSHVAIIIALFLVGAAAIRTIKTVVLEGNEGVLCQDLETT